MVHITAGGGMVVPLIYRNRPYDQEKNAAGMAANIEPDVDQARRQRLIIFIISTDCSCHQPQLDDQSRLRQRVAKWCAPGIRFNETGTDGANHCRKSGGDIAGRG